MITAKSHERLVDKIAALSELELDQLLQDIGEHLRKNKLEHLIDNAFKIYDLQDEVNDLVEKVEDLERDNDDLQDKLNEIFSLSDISGVSDDEEGVLDKLKEILEEINNKAL